MAQQTINIGTVANDGTGDPLRTAFDKVNDNFTELYSDDAGDVNQVTGTGGITASPTTGNVVVNLDDDSITYAKLGTEFTTSAALSTNVDFSTAQVFTKTLTGNTTLTFSNTAIGMVKDLVITGDYTLTLPSGSTVAGTYDGTVSNLIQIVVTGASTYWYSISQPQ
jgi:hypothetical protein